MRTSIVAIPVTKLKATDFLIVWFIQLVVRTSLSLAVALREEGLGETPGETPKRLSAVRR